MPIFRQKVIALLAACAPRPSRFQSSKQNSNLHFIIKFYIPPAGSASAIIKLVFFFKAKPYVLNTELQLKQKKRCYTYLSYYTP